MSEVDRNGRMETVTKLITAPAFADRVEAQIRAQLMDGEAEQKTGEAAVEGKVVDYELTSPLVFDAPEGQEFTWSIPFHAQGKATCRAGEEDFSNEGPIAGFVDIEIPPEALNMRQLLAGLVIDVALNRVGPWY